MIDILSSIFGQILPTSAPTTTPTAPSTDNSLFSTDPDRGASWLAAANEPREWVPWEVTEQDLGGFGNATRVAALQAPGVLGSGATPSTPSPGTPNPGTPSPVRGTGGTPKDPGRVSKISSLEVKAAVDEAYKVSVRRSVESAQSPQLSPARSELPPIAGPDDLEENYQQEIAKDPRLVSGPTEVTRRALEARPPSPISIDKGSLKAPGLEIRQMYSEKAPYMQRSRDIGSVRRVILHGTREGPTENFVKYGQKVDKARGFDPGYHFYVGRDGEIIQGAPLDKVVYGAKGKNADTVHVSFIGGDGENGLPNRTQTVKGIQLVSALGRALGLSPKSVYGHGEVQGNRHKHEAGGIAEVLRQKGWAR